jgi:hypothetical protein
MPKEATSTAKSFEQEAQDDFDMILGITPPDIPGVDSAEAEDVGNLVAGVFATGTEFARKKEEILDPPEDLEAPEEASEEEGDEGEEEPLELEDAPLLSDDETAEEEEEEEAPTDLFAELLANSLRSTTRPTAAATEAPPKEEPVKTVAETVEDFSAFLTDEEISDAQDDPVAFRKALQKFGSGVAKEVLLRASRQYEETVIRERMNTYHANQFYKSNPDIAKFVTDSSTGNPIPERVQLINVAAIQVQEAEPGIDIPALYAKLPGAVRAMAGLAAQKKSATPAGQRRTVEKGQRGIAQARAHTARRPKGTGKLSEAEKLYRETQIMKNLG